MIHQRSKSIYNIQGVYFNLYPGDLGERVIISPEEGKSDGILELSSLYQRTDNSINRRNVLLTVLHVYE